MSLEINWSLLSAPNAEAGPSKHSPRSNHGTDDPLHPSAETLTNHLISVLNTQLASTKRPSFIGPIEITSFDFGSTAPEVEIKDIRDVWRAFDEDDEDEEDEGYGEEEEEEEEVLRDDSDHGLNGYQSRRASGRSSDLFHPNPLQHQQQYMPNGNGSGNGYGHMAVDLNADGDDTASVLSSTRPQSVHAD